MGAIAANRAWHTFAMKTLIERGNRMHRVAETRWFPWLLRGVLSVVALAAYGPSFRGAFVFDDLPHIVHNRAIRSLGDLVPQLLWNNRPVVFVSLWLNFRLGELDVFGYHVWNFTVHLLAGLILFGLVRRTLRLPSVAGRFRDSADMVAFAVALLWLIHPLQTQAVTYVIQRCESMMGLFFLVSLYSLLRGSQSARPWPWYALGVASGWLGMGCKEVMFTAPLVLLLYDRIFCSSSWREVFRRRWGFYAAFVPAMIWIVAVIVKLTVLVPAAESRSSGPSAVEYLGSQPSIILYYLRLSILPDRLCFDYRWPVGEGWARVVLPGLVVLGLLLAALVALCVWPRIGFLAISFFIILAPTSSINPIHDLAVEHRMYLPLALILFLGVLGFDALIRREVPTPKHRAVIYAGVLLVFAAAWTERTRARNLLYTKPDALWKNVLAHAPENARAYNNLGCYRWKAGEREAAVALFRHAIELDPRFIEAYCNLAEACDYNEQWDEGIALMERAKNMAPGNGVLYCVLGHLRERRGDTAEALANYRRAVELSPEYGRANYRLGSLLARQGQCEEAIGHFRAALKVRPGHVGCHFRLAWACQRTGRFEDAIEHYQRALQYAPRLEKARRNLELCRAGDRDGEAPSGEADQKDTANPTGPADGTSK